MRISDWSSDVCSSDLLGIHCDEHREELVLARRGALALGGSELFGARHPWRVHVGQPELREPRTILEIGRESCRVRVCQYVSISVVAVSLKKTTKNHSLPASYEC